MTTNEWVTVAEAAAMTGGKLLTGTRMLVDGRPAEWVGTEPNWGMVAARWTDEEGGYAVNLSTHEVLIHRDAITKTLEYQENTI